MDGKYIRCDILWSGVWLQGHLSRSQRTSYIAECLTYDIGRHFEMCSSMDSSNLNVCVTEELKMKRGIMGAYERMLALGHATRPQPYEA